VEKYGSRAVVHEDRRVDHRHLQPGGEFGAGHAPLLAQVDETAADVR
jgi:hypothetical protein